MRIKVSVGDDDENRIFVDRLSFGEAPTEISRDGSPLGEFDPVATLLHNSTRTSPFSLTQREWPRKEMKSLILK